MKKLLLLINVLFLVSQASFGKTKNNNVIPVTHETIVPGILETSVETPIGGVAPTAKITAIEKHRTWLNLTNVDGAFKQLLVGYIEGATNDWDRLFDAVSLDANLYVDFYSINSGKNLTIQGRALPFVNTDEVPLGYRTTIAGTFEISISKVDGMLVNQDIFINDKSTGVFHNLKSGSYSFTTSTGTFSDRFVLVYIDKTVVVEPPVVVVPPVVAEPIAELPVVADPIVDVPIVAEPIITDPIAELPVIVDPIVEAPIVAEPIITNPIVELPVVADPIVEVPIVIEPIIADPIAELPVVADPIVEAPIVTEPIITDPIVELPVVIDPIVEVPIVAEPIITNPIAELPVVADPIVEAPIVAEPIITDPIVELPVVVDPIVEAPIVEAPIVEAPIVAGPIITDPIAELPVVVDPIVEAPIVTEPIITDPIAELPVVADPIVEAPIVAEPIITDPIAELPVVADPIVEAPIVTEPIITDSIVSDISTAFSTFDVGNQNVEKVKPVIVSSNYSQIKVNSSDENIDKIMVYTLRGRQLYEIAAINNTEFVIQNVDSSHQFLIIKTQLKNGKSFVNRIIF